MTIQAGDVAGFHDIADILATRIPNARKETLLGIGHAVPLESLDVLTALTLDFLNTVDKGSIAT